MPDSYKVTASPTELADQFHNIADANQHTEISRVIHLLVGAALDHSNVPPSKREEMQESISWEMLNGPIVSSVDDMAERVTLLLEQYQTPQTQNQSPDQS